MRLALLPLIAAAGLIAGCAAQGASTDPTLVAASSPSAAAPSVDASAIRPAPGGYQLTKSEEKLDCPKLTGQMKVRIANMRMTTSKSDGSVIGRTMQYAVTPVFGGTQRGIDTTADLQNDRAKLEAFNKRLAEKKCKTLDIDAELRGEQPPPASKGKPAKAAG